MDIRLGDVVKMKKGHPCGSNEWEIQRVGMDFRMKCLGCGHQVMLPRRQAEKNIRLILRNGTELKPADCMKKTVAPVQDDEEK